MNKKAFTIIELIVVITVLTIILVVGIVNLRSGGTIANDEERKTDVANFAKALEDYYLYGNTSATDPYVSTPPNKYPATADFGSPITSATIATLLPDLNQDNVKAPGITDPANTLIMATNNTANTYGVTPQPTINTYVYQPLASDGSLCALSVTNCRKFYIYYKLESDGAIYQLASKNK